MPLCAELQKPWREAPPLAGRPHPSPARKCWPSHAITARLGTLAAGPEWGEALAAALKALDGWKEANSLIKEAAVGDLKHPAYKLVCLELRVAAK